MSLELSGKLIKILPAQTGSGKNGAWVKQDFVIETTEQYPKKICISAWGDKADIIQDAEIGDVFNLSAIVESREYNNKWYTDLKVWNITNERAKPVKKAVKGEQPDKPKPAFMSDSLDGSEEDSDLPF